MSLRIWAEAGWLKPHTTSRQEVGELLRIVRRDLTDATAEISPDWRFGIAYNAALKLCTILLFASGYRPDHVRPHQRTVDALKFILPERAADAAYLDACRIKRHAAEYDHAGVATQDEASELVDYTQEFLGDVLVWLRQHHPQLLPSGP